MNQLRREPWICNVSNIERFFCEREALDYWVLERSSKGKRGKKNAVKEVQIKRPFRMLNVLFVFFF